MTNVSYRMDSAMRPIVAPLHWLQRKAWIRNLFPHDFSGIASQANGAAVQTQPAVR